MLERVISGGQTGGDQGFLVGARLAALPTGGWAPKGWWTDVGPAPWLSSFGLREHVENGYPPRTVENVAVADGTLIFGDHTSPGCELTLRTCIRLRRPFLLVPFPPGPGEVDRTRAWVADRRVRVLNGAGNRESSRPGIFAGAAEFLRAVLGSA